MGRCISNFSVISIKSILFYLVILNITTTSANIFQDFACATVNCGEGTCIASNNSVLGFDCECKSGWKKMQIGRLTFPSCVVPNCTLNFECGDGSPPPIPVPHTNSPPFNISNPCNLIWCGEGTCVVNGTGHYCQCYEGSENLLDQTAFACFKQCYFGADCTGFQLFSHAPPPPSPSSSSRVSGSNEAPNCVRNLHTLIIVSLSATFMRWR